MKLKKNLSQRLERLLYLLAVSLTPNIPLFFLYGRNAEQGLLFRHFLIFGAVLAVVSLTFYLLISKFALRRRRAMLIVALFWVLFWFFDMLQKIITRNLAGLSQMRLIAYFMIFICIVGFVLRFIKVSRALVNVIAVWLCLLFAFNFVPEVLTIYMGERQMVKNERLGNLPYEVKEEFYIDAELPSPNVYWLHMDGMMGFDAVEHYFGDSQTELKKQLVEQGFVINKSARLEAGYTQMAIPALMSPVFFDSYLADEFSRVSRLTSTHRRKSLTEMMRKKGASFPKNELFRAFFDAGYINIDNLGFSASSPNIQVHINELDIISSADVFGEQDNNFNKMEDFVNLIVEASALSVARPKISGIMEKKKPHANTQPLPEYSDTVSKYVTDGSDSSDRMSTMVRAMKYTMSVESPRFLYFANTTAHANWVRGSTIGGISYNEVVGRTFIHDENGNIYKERLDDPNDVHLYLPQHKYAVKQMISLIEIIIEEDPDAVIVIQGDHGIHGIGNGEDYFDSKFMYERGYSLDDQLNLNLQVISAVRIPPKYGELTQPLDPLDITRYLVNHFVGAGNYNYLFYKEEDRSK